MVDVNGNRWRLRKIFATVPPMLTPEQSRAARGWLDWSQEDLARRAGVSISTVRDFEKGRRTPIPNNINALQGALEAAGIKLIGADDGGAPGIAYLRG
jgi:transcriptional regulator with XRE-family HTH domain